MTDDLNLLHNSVYSTEGTLLEEFAYFLEDIDEIFTLVVIEWLKILKS